MALLPSSAPAQSVKAARKSAVQNLPTKACCQAATRAHNPPEAPAGSCGEPPNVDRASKRGAREFPPVQHADQPANRGTPRCGLRTARSRAGKPPPVAKASGAARRVGPGGGTERRAAAGLPAEPSSQARADRAPAAAWPCPGTPAERQASAPRAGPWVRAGTRREQAAEPSRGTIPRPAPTACRCRAPRSAGC